MSEMCSMLLEKLPFILETAVYLDVKRPRVEVEHRAEEIWAHDLDTERERSE